MKPANKLPPKPAFQACTYKGKPAVFDTQSRVFYTGYASHLEARERAEQLNKNLPRK